MFDSFDDNKDGIIDAGELAKALDHYEYAYFHPKRPCFTF
jgi:Ca2+-binding EF-hand superfamily protein